MDEKVINKKVPYVGIVAIVVLATVGVVAVQVMSKNATPVQTSPVVQNIPSKDQGQPKPNMMQPQTPPAITDAQTAELAAGAAPHNPTALTFDVTGGSFFYVPNVIHVKKGDTVTVNFLNAGGFHDFTLDEFNVKIGPTKDGETKSAEFVADKTGTFEFYCSVGTHRQLGQKGMLIVE